MSNSYSYDYWPINDCQAILIKILMFIKLKIFYLVKSEILYLILDK